MAPKEYKSEKDQSQNINDKTWQDSSSSSDSSSELILNNQEDKTKENIPQLSETDQADLDKKRNSPDFQQGLQEMLPKDGVVQKVEAPKDLPAMMQQWQKDTPKVAAEQVNATGLPDKLKAGIESLSGMSLDDVKVYYNSSKPAELNALAYAQGSDIHVAPGQEQHLAHEAWHVVQQRQGRVKATTQMKGEVNVNDNTGLEKEADVMGAKASVIGDKKDTLPLNDGAKKQKGKNTNVTQLLMDGKAFKSSSSTTRRFGFLWLQSEEVRIEPALIMTTIDAKLQECHDTKEAGGNAYYQKLQSLLTYLSDRSGDVQKAMPNVKGMQLAGETVPKEGLIYISAVEGLIAETTKDIQDAEEAKKGSFKSFAEGTTEERQDRLNFMKMKYGAHAGLLNSVPVDGTEEAALKKMLQNFYERGDFTYTFGASGAFSKKGNCMTLADEFQALATEALGIEVTSPGYKPGPFLVGNRKIVGTDMTGNIDGGAEGWVWEQHACAEYKGTIIDVLYGMWGGMPSVTGVKTGNDPDMYYTFGAEKVYLAKPEHGGNVWKTKYTKDADKATFKG